MALLESITKHRLYDSNLSQPVVVSRLDLWTLQTVCTGRDAGRDVGFGAYVQVYTRDDPVIKNSLQPRTWGIDASPSARL
jgi:hypothetical protein